MVVVRVKSWDVLSAASMWRKEKRKDLGRRDGRWRGIDGTYKAVHYMLLLTG